MEKENLSQRQKLQPWCVVGAALGGFTTVPAWLTLIPTIQIGVWSNVFTFAALCLFLIVLQVTVFVSSENYPAVRALCSWYYAGLLWAFITLGIVSPVVNNLRL